VKAPTPKQVAHFSDENPLLVLALTRDELFDFKHIE
jgi:hypothetical protein